MQLEPQHIRTRTPDWLKVGDDGMNDGLKTMHPSGAAPWPLALEPLSTGVGLCSSTDIEYDGVADVTMESKKKDINT